MSNVIRVLDIICEPGLLPEPHRVMLIGSHAHLVPASAIDALFGARTAQPQPEPLPEPKPRTARKPTSFAAQLPPTEERIRPAPKQQAALDVLRSRYPDGLTTHEVGDHLYPDDRSASVEARNKRYGGAIAALKGLRDRGLVESRQCTTTRLDKWFACEVRS